VSFADGLVRRLSGRFTTPEIHPVKNGWHALSRELNLAVWGATEQEARSNFAKAVAKDAELRARAQVGVSVR
jgi:hypothetical protein